MPEPTEEEFRQETQKPVDGRPAESMMLNSVWRDSGLTAADLAAATGMSVGAVRIALNGFRHREDGPRAVRPTDETLAKLGAALGMDPQLLRVVGRERAADLLVEAKSTVGDVDLDTKSAIAAREHLTRKVLDAFSTAELRAEIARREGGGS